MPEKRLERTRKAYITTFRLGVDTCRVCGTTGKYDCPACGCWFPPRESAAYRITQAQLAADERTAGDERL